MNRLICIVLMLLIPLACSGDGWFFASVGGGGGGCAGGSDGAIGPTTAPIADADLGNASTGTLFWISVTPTEDGTVSYGHYHTHYNSAAGGYSRIVLMDSSGNVLDHSAQQDPNPTESRTVHNVALEHGYCLETGVKYLVGVWIAADNYAGVTTNGDWGTGASYYKAGMSWSDSSFDVSSPSNVDAHRYIGALLNNSSGTPSGW